MGTAYSLKVKLGNTDLIPKFVKESESADFALQENGRTNESCKWHSHEEDLKEFSKQHPEALFELTGYGEERGDMWIKYFQNGLVQVCKAKIIFDDFDYNLLR